MTDSTKFERITELTTDEFSSGIHIVYTYKDMEKYLQNATSYIADGIDKAHKVIYIDRAKHFEAVQRNLKNIGYSEDQIGEVLHLDSDEFFESYSADFVAEKLNELVFPQLNQNQDKTLQMWSLMDWKSLDPDTLIPDITVTEKNYDAFASGKSNIIGVCSYDEWNMPVPLYNELLQTHKYHMTDQHFSQSHLYQKNPVQISSIFEKIKLDHTAENEKIRSEKLSMAGELASNIAHELHNSLASMDGALQLIQKSNDMNGTNQKYLNIFDDGIEKIRQLASEYLTLANPHVENRKKVNILQLVEDVKVHMEPLTVNKNISIHTKTDNHEIEILCEEMKLKQVFTNLVKNAIETMEEGAITIDVKDFMNDVHIYVADNGPGIPDDILNQLGKPFMTTKENGTGLGLLISEKIIKDHDGKLIVDSEVGAGTTFMISLPKSNQNVK